MKINWTLLLIGCIGMAGCINSPEASRARGGGPGGDTGNRPGDVKMHEGSDPYWKTRVLIPGEHPPLDGARQARRLATR